MIPSDNLSTLDFMRGFCTVAVVVVHWLGMTGHSSGALAILARVIVLTFFVHTGFVLMSSLERQHAHTPERLWRRFVLRRAFRIYPLSTVVLAFILLFGIPSRLVPPDFRPVALDGLGSLANFLLAMNLVHRQAILSPMWSIPYEFQLYLILPAVFLLLKRWSGLLPAVGVWCLSVVLAALQPWMLHADRLDILQFSPCFVAGILCYRLMASTAPSLPFVVWPALLAFTMMLSLFWPERLAWPAAWVSCLLAALCMPLLRQARSDVVRRCCAGIAQHSYSIYLSHYFCLWLAFRANHFQLAAQWILFLLCMAGVPMVLYRYIERPMNDWGRRLSGTAAYPPRIRSVGAALSATRA